MLPALRLTSSHDIPNRRCEIDLPSSPQDAGFVVPYVLAVIMVLAILTVWGANSLQRTQDTFLEFADASRRQGAMDLAETRFLQAFLGAAMTREGLDTSGRPVNETAIALGEPPSEEGLSPEDIWSAKRGHRTFSTKGFKVEAFYQDADGLLSVNSADIALIARWLGESFKASGAGLAAKLGDYRDSDNVRQFQGGERSDYRLLQKDPPTNSNLRSPSEIGDILGWDAVTNSLTFADLSQLTFFSSSSTPRLSAVPDELVRRLQLPVDETDFLNQEDLNDAELFMSPIPSSRAQLILLAPAGDGEYAFVRIVEIERTGGAPNRPFTRRLTWEGSIQLNELDDSFRQALEKE